MKKENDLMFLDEGTKRTLLDLLQDISNGFDEIQRCFPHLRNCKDVSPFWEAWAAMKKEIEEAKPCCDVKENIKNVAKALDGIISDLDFQEGYADGSWYIYRGPSEEGECPKLAGDISKAVDILCKM